MRTLFLTLFLLITSVAAHAADAVPATSAFPVLPFDASPDATPQLVPVAASQPLDQTHPGVTRAIIVIHDETRDANSALATLTILAGAANPTTMMIAPQFMLPSDLARVAPHLPEQGRALAVWPATSWPMGGDSLATPPQRGISSFTVIDLLLMYLADRARFPDLKTIRIAGFGAGANFTQRYAAFTVAADAVARQNIDLRYVVAGASSYLYMTGNRPLGGRKGFGHPDPAACPDYNAYPFGFEKMPPYARHVGANAAKTDYPLRAITYINATGPDALPETTCAALAQGGDAGMRADNYRLYLDSLYGDVAGRMQAFAVAKEASADALGLFGSACGMATLFGDRICSAAMGRMQ